ncbi:ABC transporter A family member 7 [Artemisia annua]|uniref:ABC transporter A family member 7 n=1 Tax=Artemisia annua TaxID=35608 RepID=A0A2U1LUV6_ARTAN|nr:ABC transporter A family member 7 [Artemisia annua]
MIGLTDLVVVHDENEMGQILAIDVMSKVVVVVDLGISCGGQSVFMYVVVVVALDGGGRSRFGYEKQQNLRIRMKMHGLGDGPYLMISYAYFLAISMVYMFCFVAFGSAVGLNFFILNDYSIPFVFYFIYVNLQIALAFLLAALFSNEKTAAVVGYITVFATGILGGFFFQPFLQDKSFSKGERKFA